MFSTTDFWSAGPRFKFQPWQDIFLFFLPRCDNRECIRNLDLQVQVHPGELWVPKSAGAHSTRSLKIISGCKRWCPKDLRVRAPAAPVIMHSLDKTWRNLRRSKPERTARVELELLHFNDIKIGMPLFFVVGCNTVMFLFVSCSAQKTITCGAAIKTAAESST